MFEEQKKELVKKLEKSGYIKSNKVKEAFLDIPREIFIPKYKQRRAYIDSPLDIGEGQTISAPHMIAIMCEELFLEPNQKVLEIGTGSGYHAAVVSKIVGLKGQVYTVERHNNLAERAKQNLKDIDIKNVTIKIGDGSKGLREYAPYDRIYVTCAAPNIPQPLVDQLKRYGVLLLPIGKMFCQLMRVEKNNKNIKKNKLCSCAFVPLIGKYGH